MFCNYVIKTPIFLNKISLCLIFMLCLCYCGFLKPLTALSAMNEKNRSHCEEDHWKYTWKSGIRIWKMAQKVPSDSNKLSGPYKAFWGRCTSKGKWEIKMWMAYVCEAPYTRQIQIHTARDLRKDRKRTKVTRQQCKDWWNNLLTAAQPVTVPELGLLALAVPDRKSASDGTDTTGLGFCFFF